MRIPETPSEPDKLDLMRRLKQYADGTASWRDGEVKPDDRERRDCDTLYTNLRELVKHLNPLLDRIAMREMATFTLHDKTHSCKVAHLMWHILKPERRLRLTPPEIGLLVVAAHLHDLGMGLSREERERRLAPESDLWQSLPIEALERLEKLRKDLSNPDLADAERARLVRQVVGAEEALLCADTRDRHATRERYLELLERIPSISGYLVYQGDSFEQKLVDICVSHNQEARVLVQRESNRDLFQSDYPVGGTTADLHMVAAALRLADILDLDRERTPPSLFHYLFPGPLSDGDRSALEWSKHLLVSHWELKENEIRYRGRSNNHVVHHALVQFCDSIAAEIAATLDTFDPQRNPFAVPTKVIADIVAEGYTYFPYRFELDDQHVYELLMGGAIYDYPLVAVRELIQNAVDACKLRDALTVIQDPGVEPSQRGRILVTYTDAGEQQPSPTLELLDRGIGMDAWVIRNYFLKVGLSYYRSPEFDKQRIAFRRAGEDVDFAPVSEFGIGFLSSFLLADRVIVETAMALDLRGDTRKIQLTIDGPSRLIRCTESARDPLFKGTSVRLVLVRGARWNRSQPPSWEEIRNYVNGVCAELPYDVTIVHQSAGHREEHLVRGGLKPLVIPPHLESKAIRIPVNNVDAGLEGDLVLLADTSWKKEAAPAGDGLTLQPELPDLESTLIRGGFRVGDVDEGFRQSPRGWGARLRMSWRGRRGRRYAGTNLARTTAGRELDLREEIELASFRYLVANWHALPEDKCLVRCAWSETPPRWLKETGDSLALYQSLRRPFLVELTKSHGMAEESLQKWEAGEITLPLPSAYHYHGRALWHVLPRISEAVIAGGKMSLQPLGSGQLEKLRGFDDWSRPPGWRYAEFTEDYTDWLLWPAATVAPLNERYKPVLEELIVGEAIDFADLHKALRLLAARVAGSRSPATEGERRLVPLLQAVLPEALIGNRDRDDKRREVRVRQIRLE